MHHRTMENVQAVQSQADQHPDHWPAEYASDPAANHHRCNAGPGQDNKFVGQDVSRHIQQGAATRGDNDASDDPLLRWLFHARHF